MAENEEWEDNIEDPKAKTKEKKHDAGAYDLDKVVDHGFNAEEQELSSADISGVMDQIGEDVAERMAKEKELLKVQIKKEDVELIVRELEISKERAEMALREHGGNLMETLTELTN